MAGATLVYVGAHARGKPSDAEKVAITLACGHLITAVLVPRFLPQIGATEFNYPVEITGKWHGGKYRFITRYRSDRPDAVASAFDAPFARLDYVGRDLFNLFWHRRTGQWHCVAERKSLVQALSLIELEPYFRPC